MIPVAINADTKRLLLRCGFGDIFLGYAAPANDYRVLL